MGVASPRRAISWRVGIVVDFAAGEVGKLGIEQRRHSAQDTAFRLSAQAEQNEIVAGKNGVDDLRHDGVVVTDYAGEDGSVAMRSKTPDQVVTEFVLHRPGARTLFRESTVAQVTKCARKTHDRNSRDQDFPDYTPGFAGHSSL
jgi:hypothetical protein